MSANPPFVIHVFSPFRTKLPSACRVARVLAPNASDPEPGSLRQYAPIVSPSASLGRYFRFCSGVPNSENGRIIRFTCAPNVARERRRPRHALADDHRRDLVEFEAPVLFGDVDAEQAELAARAEQPACEVPVLLLQPIEYGRTSLRTKARTVSRRAGAPRRRAARA